MIKKSSPTNIIKGSPEDLAERKAKKMDKHEAVDFYLDYLKKRKEREIEGNSRNP